jgi:hypothetical protein
VSRSLIKIVVIRKVGYRVRETDKRTLLVVLLITISGDLEKVVSSAVNSSSVDGSDKDGCIR